MSTSGVHKCHRLLRVPPALLLPRLLIRGKPGCSEGLPVPGSRRLHSLRARMAKRRMHRASGGQDPASRALPGDRKPEQTPGRLRRRESRMPAASVRRWAWAAPSGVARTIPSLTRLGFLTPSGGLGHGPIAYAIGLPDGEARSGNARLRVVAGDLAAVRSLGERERGRHARADQADDDQERYPRMHEVALGMRVPAPLGR
jgi:hypothetical protein